MKRKTSALLVVTALLGAVATAFLFVLYSDDTGPDRARSSADADRAGGRGRGADSKSKPAIHHVGPKSGTRLKNDGAYPGMRPAPEDSAETVRMRHADSMRVLAILDEIMTVENRQKRWDLHRELKKLLARLGHRVEPAVRNRLLEMLKTADPRWRPLVGDALGQLQGDEIAAKALISMIRGGEAQNVYTRHAVYTALGKMNVKSVLPELMGMLGQGHRDEHLIVRAAGQLAGPEETGKLLDMLDGTLRPETRREIQRVLVEKRNYPNLLADVQKKLVDADADTRASLIHVLASGRKAEHGATIRKILEGETDQTVRDAAIRALGQIGDPESGRRLLEMVERGTPLERRKAASAMRYIKDPKTVDELAGNWDRMNDDGRRALMGAAAALPQPSKKLVDLATKEGLFDKEMRVRTAAVRLLGRTGQDSNVEAIAQYLDRAKHPSEWSSALRALLKVNTKKAAERGLSRLDVVPDKRSRDNYARQFNKILERSR